MSALDRAILKDLGFDLSDQQFAQFAEHFDATLNGRVTDGIATEITPEQAREMAGLQQASDERLSAWLSANVPNLDEIVSDEIDVLMGEVAEISETFGGPRSQQALSALQTRFGWR